MELLSSMLHLLSHHRRKYWVRNEEKSILSSAKEIWAFFFIKLFSFFSSCRCWEKKSEIKFQSKAHKAHATDEICSLKENCKEIMDEKNVITLTATVFTRIDNTHFYEFIVQSFMMWSFRFWVTGTFNTSKCIHRKTLCPHF